jgi:hypothetical protein
MARLPAEARAVAVYDDLLRELNWWERSLATRILARNPRDLGFKGPFFSLKTPADLVRVEPPNLPALNPSVGVQYCPAPVWQDYLQMMAGMERDLGKRLYIDSGYRSPGRQAYLFIKYLVTNHNYSLQETARWVALPGYSEHGSPERTALDFINADGINGENPGQTAADFENLPEYQWLVQNARRVHFFLSYPRDNPWGVTFEPWHWHWEGELR